MTTWIQYRGTSNRTSVIMAFTILPEMKQCMFMDALMEITSHHGTVAVNVYAKVKLIPNIKMKATINRATMAFMIFSPFSLSLP